MVLGLVLIIGYHYHTKHPIKRLELVRTTGYHIYFKAGFAGFSLLVLSVFLWLIIDYYDLPSNTISYLDIKKNIDFINDHNRWFEIKTVCVFIMMILISAIHRKIVEIHYRGNKDKLFSKITKIANELEKLIITSTADVKPIRLDLECGKVYVGVPEYPDLEGGELTFVTIMPLLSGRRNERNEIEFSNNYYKHYQVNQFTDHNSEIDWDQVYDFKIVIPTKSILIASHFDPEAYLEIQNDNDSELITSPSKTN